MHDLNEHIAQILAKQVQSLTIDLQPPTPQPPTSQPISRKVLDYYDTAGINALKEQEPPLLSSVYPQLPYHETNTIRIEHELKPTHTQAKNPTNTTLSIPTPTTSLELLEHINRVKQTLETQRLERQQRLTLSFQVTIVAMIVGILLMSCGILCIFTLGISASLIPNLSGITSNIAGVATFRLYKTTAQHVTAIVKDIALLDRALLSLHIIHTIADKSSRDKALAKLATDLQATF